MPGIKQTYEKAFKPTMELLNRIMMSPKYSSFNIKSASKNSNPINMISNKIPISNLKILTDSYNQYPMCKPIKHLFQAPETNHFLHTSRWSLLEFNLKHWIHEKFFCEQTISKKENSTSKEELEENWGGPEAFRAIIFLKEDIDEVLKKHVYILVFYSASWCKHCATLRKPFGKAAVMAKEADLPVKFATFDVDINHSIADSKGIVGVPLLKFYENGQFVSNYKGKRTAEDLFLFVKNPPKSYIESKKADI